MSKEIALTMIAYREFLVDVHSMIKDCKPLINKYLQQNGE